MPAIPLPFSYIPRQFPTLDGQSDPHLPHLHDILIAEPYTENQFQPTTRNPSSIGIVRHLTAVALIETHFQNRDWYIRTHLSANPYLPFILDEERINLTTWLRTARHYSEFLGSLISLACDESSGRSRIRRPPSFAVSLSPEDAPDTIQFIPTNEHTSVVEDETEDEIDDEIDNNLHDQLSNEPIVELILQYIASSIRRNMGSTINSVNV